MDLSVEYGRWKLINDIFSSCSKMKCVDKKCTYELSNILERWMLSMINYSFKKNLILSKTDITDTINKKAIAELKEKHIVTDNVSDFFYDNVLSKVNDYVDKDVKIVKGRCILGKNFIKYKDFRKEVSVSVMSRLKKYKKHDVIKCALRYGLVISKSQQWSVPTSQYDLLFDKHNVRYEGFASPFNSKLMGRGNFCSVFEDTDAVFGSIGSFFNTNMTDNATKDEPQCWTVNPPYIDKILIDSASHILKNMDSATKKNKKLFVFYIMPGWFDSKAFEILKKSKYCKRMEILKRGKHFYEHNDSIITARFNSVVFILDNFSTKKYNTICSGMKY